jgi:signal transduction histidine kinase
MQSAQQRFRREPDRRTLLAYITNLELEVDRLRREGRFMQNQLRDTLKWMTSLRSTSATPSDLPLAEVNRTAEELLTVMRDLQQTPAYHPARDQVVAIAVRPLIERIFRLEQRLQGAGEAKLRLDLATEHMDWFPARLRHILDTLILNALKYRDESKPDNWVLVGLRQLPNAYELSVADNGLGLEADEGTEVFELMNRATSECDEDICVGLAVIKLLVEQSGGRLSVSTGEGQGARFIAILPRFDVSDYLD